MLAYAAMNLRVDIYAPRFISYLSETRNFGEISNLGCHISLKSYIYSHHFRIFQ